MTIAAISDTTNHVGYYHLPAGECCDMEEAILVFTAMDPRVRRIVTFSGFQPDTFYVRTRKGWEARSVDG